MNYKKHYFLIFFLLILLLPTKAQKHSSFNNIQIEKLPNIEIVNQEGLSGHFCGKYKNYIIVAGGCNFPTPLTKNGEKKFYSEIRLLDINHKDKGWKIVGNLPYPLAYGGSIETPEGLICIGGSNSNSKSKDVFLISFNRELNVKKLTTLPIGLDQTACAKDENYIFLIGGATEKGPSNKIYFIPMKKLLASSTYWDTLCTLDGPRVQPCATIQKGSLSNNLYILGGFNPNNNHLYTNVISFNLTNKSWNNCKDNIAVPPLIGSTAVPSGSQFILCFGGVNSQIFEDALIRNSKLEKAIENHDFQLIDKLKNENLKYLSQPPSWYKFRKSILVYNTITKTYSDVFSSSHLARAGSSIIKSDNNKYIIIGGETKPGVRSSEANIVAITYNAHFGYINWIVLSLYLLAMIALGFYFMKSQKGGDDFFRGGGRIPWWAAGISIFATMLSAITYMSIPAKAYATDWTYYPMQICILLVSFPVIKYYLPFFRRLKVASAYEYLECRFNSTLRLLASSLFIIFMIARMALVLFLPSLALTAVTGINIGTCIVLMAVITIAYCTMGGMEAVVWGDVVQGIILVGGAIIAAVYLICNTGGGFTGFYHIATEHHKFQLIDWSFNFTNATFWVIILGGLANNLISYTSDQTVIQRYLTTKDEKSAAKGIYTNGIMSIIVTIAFFTIGTGLFTFFKTHPAEIDITMNNTDTIFPFFIMSQLPVGVAGLLIAAIFAATMSTIGSNINSVSTAFTIDIWQKYFHNLSSKQIVNTARISGIISGFIGMLIALLMTTFSIQSLLDYFNTILGLLSGGIGALFLMGIFFPRIGAKSALIGFISGTASVFYLNFYTHINFLLFGFISIVISIIIALICSLFFKVEKDITTLTWSTLDDNK